MNNTKVICYHEVERLLNNVRDFDVSENPFLSYAFLSVYLKYHPHGNFYFFNVIENDKVIAIIPFECTFESSLLYVKKFRFIGYRNFNYEQYICLDKDMEKVHNIFMSYLKTQKYSVVLNIYDINNASPLYGVLEKDVHPNRKLQLYACPCLHFTENFDEFFKNVYTSAKKRTELKKFQRKVSELGDFKIVNVEDKAGYDANMNYLNQIYKVHSERFADVYATSFFGSEKMRPYYSELIKSLMYGEKAHISLLILDEVVIAFIFCLTNGKVLIDWIPAFDPAFAKYSLGIVQYKMLFEEICNQGKYQLFDYSKGSSVYKRKWAKEETYNYQFLINLSRWNPFAWLFYAIDKAKFTFKVYLRNKGLLSWIKHKLGEMLSFIHRDKKEDSTLRVKTISLQEESTFKFNYAKLNNLPVENREVILTALYQGEKVVSVSKEEIVLAK
ncbi:MAG: GNAT family N-acetyltransferase [Bacteroidales bacterium]|nr:GNAT family N-acetyltransferase [Bacteroidales bacterium]